MLWEHHIHTSVEMEMGRNTKICGDGDGDDDGDVLRGRRLLPLRW